MRDWYALGQLTLLPMAATLALHLALLLVLVVRWQPASEARTIEARVASPSAIKATLIDAASLKPPKTKKKPAKKPPARVKKTPAKKIVATKPAVKPAPAKPKPEPKPEPKPDPRVSAEELAALSRRELTDALDAEDSVQVAVTAEQMSASYAALIRETVVNSWSRPPSARNGMEALLAIQLVPTGEIVSVSVVRSSGNSSFDRSAMNAIEKAGSFPELRNLPTREFEKTFRRFQLLFRPEDLRY
ncbi:MAG: TonB family protein [Congregibacter sp.]